METLILIGWIILGIVLVMGIVRVIIRPYNGFLDFILEMFWLDFLLDLLEVVFENISDLFD